MRVRGGTVAERALAALAYWDGRGLREQAVARVVDAPWTRVAAALRELRAGGLVELQSDSGADWRVWEPTPVGRRRAWELVDGGVCEVYRPGQAELADTRRSPPRRRAER